MKTQLIILLSVVISIFLNACESRTVNECLEKRILILENNCLHYTTHARDVDTQKSCRAHRGPARDGKPEALDVCWERGEPDERELAGGS